MSFSSEVDSATTESITCQSYRLNHDLIPFFPFFSFSRSLSLLIASALSLNTTLIPAPFPLLSLSLSNSTKLSSRYDCASIHPFSSTTSRLAHRSRVSEDVRVISTMVDFDLEEDEVSWMPILRGAKEMERREKEMA